MIVALVTLIVFGAGAVITVVAGRRLKGLKIDPINSTVPLLLLGIGCFVLGCYLGLWREKLMLYYALTFVSGGLLISPTLTLTMLYLLWWNPKKYKEYEMKKRMRERAAQD